MPGDKARHLPLAAQLDRQREGHARAPTLFEKDHRTVAAVHMMPVGVVMVLGGFVVPVSRVRRFLGANLDVEACEQVDFEISVSHGSPRHELVLQLSRVSEDQLHRPPGRNP